MISSPSTHLKPGWHAPRSEAWCPQKKPWVGAHPDERPSCLSAETQSQGSVCTQISGTAAWAHRPKSPVWVHTPISGLGPTPETSRGCTPRSAVRLHRRTGPKPGIGAQPDQQPGCPLTTTSEEQVLNNSDLAPAHRALRGLLTL